MAGAWQAAQMLQAPNKRHFIANPLFVAFDIFTRIDKKRRLA